MSEATPYLTKQTVEIEHFIVTIDARTTPQEGGGAPYGIDPRNERGNEQRHVEDLKQTAA